MNLETRRDILRCYYASRNSPVAALRLYKKEKGLKHDPCDPTTVTKLVKRFEETYTLMDKPKSGRKSLADERRSLIDDAKTYLQTTSIRAIAAATGIPKSSVYRLLRNDPELYPYKMSLVEELNEWDKPKRLTFANWLQENLHLISRILWSDEAHFYLDGRIIRHNCRIWSRHKTENDLELSLNGPRLTLWMGFTSEFALEPFIFDENEHINADNYLAMLQQHVRPQLVRKGKLSQTIFMQDDAPAHFAPAIKDFLVNTFTGERVISPGCSNEWPPRSPDIIPVDYWFWGCLKSKIFHNNCPTTLFEMKCKIIEACNNFTIEDFSAAVANLPKRVEHLIQAAGGNIDHIV
ncbi:transposable element Tc3 transposase [Octopus vulgaris]|uniref:Transposable element Tc3 transposase n=1 Tax=Octopus vulgaris TaxID=6645 RepID=A0AA36AZ60_OCTVU|nr:transposable element Tc3 transposase [Octopus vulgaris]